MKNVTILFQVANHTGSLTHFIYDEKEYGMLQYMSNAHGTCLVTCFFQQHTSLFSTFDPQNIEMVLLLPSEHNILFTLVVDDTNAIEGLRMLPIRNYQDYEVYCKTHQCTAYAEGSYARADQALGIALMQEMLIAHTPQIVRDRILSPTDTIDVERTVDNLMRVLSIQDETRRPSLVEYAQKDPQAFAKLARALYVQVVQIDPEVVV